jgi:hypothetical protein
LVAKALLPPGFSLEVFYGDGLFRGYAAFSLFAFQGAFVFRSTDHHVGQAYADV